MVRAAPRYEPRPLRSLTLIKFNIRDIVEVILKYIVSTLKAEADPLSLDPCEAVCSYKYPSFALTDALARPERGRDFPPTG